MKNYYDVSGLLFYVSGFLSKNWRKFETENCKTSFDIEFLGTEKEIHGLEYTELTKPRTNIIRKDEDIMLVDSTWRHATVIPLRRKEHAYNFLCQLFYTHAVQRHILYLHSSLIDYQGHGLMFLGPSGIGKTTQAELWNQYRDALIINGDVVFVQETPEAFLGWGTPWHGSSPYCENTNVPVCAMIVLKQAPENSIRELMGFEKVTAVSNSVFYPRWLENGMELCLETLDHLLTKLPVYELSCRPDEDAVKLTEETIFGK